MFQPKGNSRCWVAAIDTKRLVMLKKVCGRIRAYGIPQTKILPYTLQYCHFSLVIHGERPKERLDVTTGYIQCVHKDMEQRCPHFCVSTTTEIVARRRFSRF